MIIGLSGRAGSGKDTLADYLVEKHGFIKVAFAEPLKNACAALFGFTQNQLYDVVKKEEIDEFWQFTPRHAMQVLGTDCIRATFGQTFFLRCLQKRIDILKRVHGDGVDIVVSDVRFENEAAMMNEVWRIERTETFINSNANFHVSETALDQCDNLFALRIENVSGNVEKMFSLVTEHLRKILLAS